MYGGTYDIPKAGSWTPGGNGSIIDTSYCRGKIRITGFGRFYKGQEVDWSFRPFQKFEDGKLDLESARLLPQAAAEYGASELLAPRPVFGTDVCAVSDLRIRIPFEHNGKRVTLLRGKEADIAILAPGETFAISVGGCPVGWMFDPHRPERLVVAHMGLQCLIDKPLVVKGQKSRIHSSVINRMWESMRLLPGDASRVQAGFAFPINPLEYKHEWDYPGSGGDNRRICEYLAGALGTNCIIGWDDKTARRMGRIHLGNVIMRQFAQLGITNRHGLGSPDTVGADGHPLWYVTRGPHGKDPRNLVLIRLYA